MQAVILAGGLGTRLREETEYRPKPMVEIGGKPLLWHLMKLLSQQDLNDFIICLGYKGEQIKDFFLNYSSRVNDITLKLDDDSHDIENYGRHEEKWNVTLANTGQHTMTGGRILKVRKYIKGKRFLCTYGDGLSDINLEKLVKFHTAHGKIATVTAVNPTSRFGALDLGSDNLVYKFAEKPKSQEWINGGFFIFETEIFDYLTDNCVLEGNPMEMLAKDKQLMAYKHEGFWQPMDTYRESQELNELWNNNAAPWKTWS